MPVKNLPDDVSAAVARVVDAIEVACTKRIETIAAERDIARGLIKEYHDALKKTLEEREIETKSFERRTAAAIDAVKEMMRAMVAAESRAAAAEARAEAAEASLARMCSRELV